MSDRDCAELLNDATMLAHTSSEAPRAKIERTSVASIGTCECTLVNTLRAKWVCTSAMRLRARCERLDEPGVVVMITSYPPESPRALSERRNDSHPAPSSAWTRQG